jgi:hypothetical protein
MKIKNPLFRLNCETILNDGISSTLNLNDIENDDRIRGLCN